MGAIPPNQLPLFSHSHVFARPVGGQSEKLPESRQAMGTPSRPTTSNGSSDLLRGYRTGTANSGVAGFQLFGGSLDRFALLGAGEAAAPTDPCDTRPPLERPIVLSYVRIMPNRISRGTPDGWIVDFGMESQAWTYGIKCERGILAVGVTEDIARVAQ